MDDRGSVALLAAFFILVLVVVVGVTIDVTQVFTLRAGLQSAADAAALTGAVVARDSSSGGAQASDRTKAQSSATDQFSEAAGRTGSPATSTSTVTYDNGLITSTMDWQGTFSPAFSQIIGITSWPVSGTASAKVSSSQPGYVDIYFVIDVSHSMAIGATSSDQSLMMQKIGCTVGCHMNSGQDTIAKARNAGATLRLDVVKSAITSVLGKAKTVQSNAIAAGRGPVIRVAFLTYSDTMKTYFALSSDLNAATTALSGIDIDSSVGQTGTNVHALFNSLASAGLVYGDGKTAAKPKSYVLLMTDGIENSTIQISSNKLGSDPSFVRYSPYSRFTSLGYDEDIQGFDPALCSVIKLNGAYVMTLNVDYLIPTLSPDTSDNRYLFIKNTLKSKIQTNMSACASTPEMALYASSSADIATAVDKLFTLALSSAVYLAK